MCLLRYQAKCKLDTWNPRSEVASVRGNLWLKKVLLYFSPFLCYFKMIIANLSIQSTLWHEEISTVALKEPVELLVNQSSRIKLSNLNQCYANIKYQCVHCLFCLFFIRPSFLVIAEECMLIVSATLPPYAFIFGNLHKQQNIKTGFITPLKHRKYMQNFKKETMGVKLKSLNPKSY